MFNKFPIIIFLFFSFCIFSCTETPVIENPDDEVVPIKTDNKIRIFVTSTLGSKFESYPLGKDSKKMIGGFARIMSELETKRSEGIPSITISNGNDVGGEIFEYFYGVATMQILNAMKYDLICPGKAEFSMGESIFVASMRDTKFDVVLANGTFENRGIKRKLKSHVIKNIGGFKIGFFGLIDPEIKNDSKLAADSVIFDDLNKIAEIEVKQLKNEGAELICLVTNLSQQTDVEILAKIPGINVIFDSIEEANEIKTFTNSIATPAGTQKNWKTLVVNCKKFGAHLGMLELTLTKNGSETAIVDEIFENIPVSDEIPENPTIKDKVNEYLSMMPTD